MPFKMKGFSGFGSSPVKKERLSDSRRGFTQKEFDAYRKQKINEGFKAGSDDLKAVMDAYRERKKPTYLGKISKKDLLKSGGISANSPTKKK
jgi:hypothetical protein|tara:strand:+ start:365 stop:640 length:276 start_codon:yes stop_codon:yes gene_type:complete